MSLSISGSVATYSTAAATISGSQAGPCGKQVEVSDRPHGHDGASRRV